MKVNKEKMSIALNLQIDENICTMFEYFDIFLGRMMMCRGAAEILGARFKLTANGSKVRYFLKHQEVVLFPIIIRCWQNSSESRKKKNEFRNKFSSYLRGRFFVSKMALVSNGMKKTERGVSTYQKASENMRRSWQ